jgi:hypothetical protein
MSNDTHKKIETFIDDTRDRVDELKERAQAAIHNTKADVDAAKRDARHPTTPPPDKV